jgi:hypothetical protein
MSVVTLLVLLLVLYLSTLVEDARVRRVFQVVIVLCICLWVLDFAGVLDLDDLRVRRRR